MSDIPQVPEGREDLARAVCEYLKLHWFPDGCTLVGGASVLMGDMGSEPVIGWTEKESLINAINFFLRDDLRRYSLTQQAQIRVICGAKE